MVTILRCRDGWHVLSVTQPLTDPRLQLLTHTLDSVYTH